MIDFLSKWSQQIVVTVIIVTILEMILPENNNKKYIKVVIGVYILFVIVYPFINNKDKINFNQIELEKSKTTVTQEVNQESMDKRLQELYMEQIESDIKSKVEKKGYTVLECQAEMELGVNSENKGIKKIVIKIDKNVKKGKENIENQVVNKVEIKIGIEKYIKDKESETINDDDINNLKSELSKYYEIDEQKINIIKS